MALATTRAEWSPDASPNGKRLAFASDQSGSYEIWSSDLAGADLIRHTAFQEPLVSTPRWAPNSRKLIFDARPDGSADLYLVGAESRLPRRLTTDSSDELNGSWSRDGAWIYYGSNRTGAWQIWKMPSGGGASIQVTGQGGFNALEGVEGRFLYYTKHDAKAI